VNLPLIKTKVPPRCEIIFFEEESCFNGIKNKVFVYLKQKIKIYEINFSFAKGRNKELVVVTKNQKKYSFTSDNFFVKDSFS
jgi:hypothetical protein